MKGNGRMTFSMGRARKPGQMVRSTKGNTLLERNTELAFILGTMDHATTASGSRTKFAESEPTHGSMAASIKVNGSTTTWREWVSTLGKMGDDMKVNIVTIRSTGMVSTHGPIIECIKECGSAGSNMVLVFTRYPGLNQSTVSGKMESVLNGLIKTMHRQFSMAS